MPHWTQFPGPLVDPVTTEGRHTALEAIELADWQTAPASFVGYYTTKTVSTRSGTVIGTVLSYTIYTGHSGGRLITLRMRGTNGAEYWGRASYDNGSVVKLRKVRTARHHTNVDAPGDRGPGSDDAR